MKLRLGPANAINPPPPAPAAVRILGDAARIGLVCRAILVFVVVAVWVDPERPREIGVEPNLVVVAVCVGPSPCHNVLVDGDGSFVVGNILSDLVAVAHPASWMKSKGEGKRDEREPNGHRSVFIPLGVIGVCVSEIR